MTGEVPSAAEPRPDARVEDEKFLGTLLSEFVAKVADGVTVDISVPLRARPDLTTEIQDTLQLAHDISLCRPPISPKLGDHEILAELGHGGMGTVYLARDLRLARLVALKALLRPRLDIGRARDRFEREARAIAKLRHPHIAQVFEIGEAGDVPYFTMELIEGRSLAAVLDELRSLGKAPGEIPDAAWTRAVFGDRAPAARVPATSHVELVCRLCVQVARALEHAHAHGIVHRDIKPSNILLRRNGDAVLCDFGLARLDDALSLTHSADVVGTPRYMAPEQIETARGPVDQRSDVYALGATLYECLALDAPFRADSTQALLAKVLNEVPLPLHKRGALIPRDLETICATALEKEPGRRYQTAGDLAADLENLLSLRPITARPIGSATRMLRFAQRNRALTASLLLLTLLLVATPLALLWENAKTLREAQRRGSISEYLQRFLRAADPESQGSGGGRDVKVITVLENAARELESRFAGDDELRADLELALGRTYEGLGLYIEAERLLRLAWDKRCARSGRGSREALEAGDGLAAALLEGGRRSEADQLAREIMMLAIDNLDETDDVRLSIESNAAWVAGECGRLTDAERVNRSVYGRRLRKLTEEHEDTLTSLENLAATLDLLGRHAEAEDMFNRAIAIRKRVSGLESPHTLRALNNLACSWFQRGYYARAEQLLGEVLAVRRRVLGRDHRITLQTAGFLAEIMRNFPEAQRRADPRAMLEDCVALATEKLSDGERILHDLQLKLARALDWGSETARTEQLLDLAIGGFERSSGRTSHDVIFALCVRGKVREYLKRNAEAEADFRDAIERARSLDPNVVLRADAQVALGQNLQMQGRSAEAEPLLERAVALRKSVSGLDHQETIVALVSLSQVLMAQGKLERVLEVKTEELKGRNARFGESNQDALQNAGIVAELMRRLNRLDDAEQVLGRALEVAIANYEPDHDVVTDLRFKRARLLQNRGRRDESDSELLEVERIRTAKHGPSDDMVLVARAIRAESLEDRERYAEAEKVWREAWKVARQLPGSNQVRWGISGGLGLNLVLQHRLFEAEPYLAPAYKHLKEILGEGRAEVKKARAGLIKIWCFKILCG